MTESDQAGMDSLPTTITDFRRGCGTLEGDSAYLTSDVSAFAPPGSPPAFVEFETPIPYREGTFRTFKRINGWGLLLEAAHGTSPLTETDPSGDVIDALDRAAGDAPGGSQAGELRSLNAQDLLMFVGNAHYPSPEEFIEEAKKLGVSKKIPASANQEPPTIDPGRTRLFLAHRRAIPGDDVPEDVFAEDEDPEDHEFVAGIIGYAYLTRSVYTEDATGEHPAWVKEATDGRPDFDAVSIGESVPETDPAHPQYVPDPRREALAEHNFQTLRSMASRIDDVEGLGKNPSRDDLIEALLETDESFGVDTNE